MKNRFSLSNYKVFTGNMGKLIPTWWEVFNPGEIVKIRNQGLIRFAPLVAPVMHPVVIRFHNFLVPIRHLWDSWEDFWTKGVDGDEEPTHPYRNMNAVTVQEGSLFDYLGIPPADYTGTGLTLNALALRAYRAIFNEYYRDKDLVTAMTVDTSDAADTGTTALQNVAWFSDSFNTARSFEQRGDEIMIPLIGDPPVKGIGKANQNFPGAPQNAYETGGSGTTAYADAIAIDSGAADNIFYVEEDPDAAGYPNIRVDMESDVGIYVSDMRLSRQLQLIQEKMTYVGGDYGEYLRSIGIRANLDARLQKPEYLGGGKATMNISEVLSTDGANTGDMKGHGITTAQTRRIVKYIPEHSIVMSLMSVVPINMYGNGIERKWFPEVKEDYLVPELQLTGQQEIYNKELYSEHSSPDGTFGYQPMYDHMRSGKSGVAGEMRSTLSEYHLARVFGSDPSLNSTFIQCEPKTDIFAAPSSDQLRCMVNHDVSVMRSLVKYPKRSIK